MIYSLDKPLEKNSNYNNSLNYQYPDSVGPLYMNFPLLDSITILTDSTTGPQNIIKSSRFLYSDNDILSTGTVYRSISISPLNGSDMTGGLRMQLQGKLSDNMEISGILSDEQSPIQPEGNTQSIEEIDQVYFHVSHPNFELDAGDIIFQNESGIYNHVNKRLVGIKNTFHVDDWSGYALFAGSKGQYRQKEFKGTEGKQGPYFLDSDSGNRNIVVIAGSERVYLFGIKLTRGENNDYTIDYTTGELFFTPQNLIYSDSDILIEYQYSDFKYHQNIVGGTMSRNLNEKGNLSISWLSEKDQIKGSSLNISREDMNLLSKAGDLPVSRWGGIQDSSGDYIYIGREYFQYEPSDTVLGDRYNVTFTNDNEDGEYRRLISQAGKIYYEYLPINMRETGDDLYSPLKKLG